MGCEGYLTKIKLKCPRCGAVWYRESLEVVLKEVEEMWKAWEDSMTEEQKQTVRKRNNLERLQKILDKEGHILMFCQTCRLLTTIQVMQKQQGIGG